MRLYKLSLLAGVSSIVFAGCSQQTTAPNETVAQVPTLAPTAPAAETTQVKEQEQLKIDDFLKAVLAKKMKASNGKPVEVKNRGEGCGFLNASDCALLEFYSGSVQIAEFDTSITSGKEALEKLKKDGFMGQSYLFNKNLAIAKNQKVAQWDEVKAIFESM